jgi:hypothetical protein
LFWDASVYARERILPSPPVFVYLLDILCTPSDIVRGLSGVAENDAAYIRDVVDVAKGTGVIVGLASCVERIVVSQDLRPEETLAYRRESYKLKNLRLLSSREAETFPKPLSFKHTGTMDIKDNCIVSNHIRRGPTSKPFEVDVTEVGDSFWIPNHPPPNSLRIDRSKGSSIPQCLPCFLSQPR